MDYKCDLKHIFLDKSINPVKILQDLVVKRTLVLPYAVPMEAVVSSLIPERFATAASSLQVRKGHWNWQALEATVKAELRSIYLLLLHSGLLQTNIST